MNLWTAENTVLAVIKELDPLLVERLEQTQLESLVEKEAIQLLEEIQQLPLPDRLQWTAAPGHHRTPRLGTKRVQTDKWPISGLSEVT